ncbi:unnamed protein product, partial [Adineta steineri]
MDECERIYSHLDIMFNCRLACLSTIQYLKSKFGQGYIVEIVEAFLLTQTQSILIFQVEK